MSYFWNSCFDFGNAVAISMPDGTEITYTQLLQRAEEIASSIQDGHLVAIECENHPDCIAAYLGCLRHRIVPLLVDSSLGIVLRQGLYERFSPVAIWCRSDANGMFAWKHTKMLSPALHSELALLLSTSGTTGSPQLVRLSRQNLQANASSIVSYLSVTEKDRAITSLPMHYSYGLSIINTHILSGGCLLLTQDSVMERGFWSFMKEGKATSFAGVPTVYDMLRRLRIERMELPNLRLMTQAGGRLLPESVRWFGNYAESKNIEFFVMYGQTEATARMSYMPMHYMLQKPSSIGIPIPGGEFLLRDTQGNTIVSSEEEGELVYRGGNVMLGYAEHPDDLSKGDELFGELSTGDLAKRDSDGFYYIVGRLKRFIKIHGNRIGLDEVEQRIQNMGINAYATGRDDMLMIALVNTSIAPSMIQDVLTKDYKMHHSVIKVVQCNEVPLSNSGKILYPELLKNIDSVIGSK